MPFDFKPLDLPGLVLIQARAFPDERGIFMETYRESIFTAAGINERFVQSNLSRSKGSVLRGLHYQVEPKAQGKLVQVLEGSIYDVAVDIEPGSPYFGRWVASEMSAEQGSMLYVPPQYAHGFCVLGDGALVCYNVTEEYHPESERGVLWSDPELAIPWPIKEPVVSAKDRALPLIESLRRARQRS